MLHNTILG